MGRFYFGQIVATWFDDGCGNTKPRPSVILSDDQDCNEGGSILVVMISKSPTKPCPHYHIQVHDGYTKDTASGLYYPCWAKCNIAREMESRRIEGSWGNMPDPLLEQIVIAFDKLFDDSDFKDWQ